MSLSLCTKNYINEKKLKQNQLNVLILYLVPGAGSDPLTNAVQIERCAEHPVTLKYVPARDQSALQKFVY